MNHAVSTYETVERNDAEYKAIRDRLLFDLIWDSRVHPETIRRRLLEKGIHPYFSYPALALFEISGSFQDVWTKRSAANELRTLIDERIPSDNAVFMDDTGQIGVLFSWDERETVLNLHAGLQDLFPHPVTVGIGSPCQYLSELHTSYRQAILSLQHKFYKGVGQVIFFNCVDAFANMIVYPEDIEEELLRHLIASAAEPARQTVDAFYEALLHNGPLQPKELIDATIRLLIGTQLRAKAEAGRTCASIKPDIMSVLHMETLEEIKENIILYLQRLGNAIHDQTTEGINRVIIKKTLTLMESECETATLHSVAEKVFITPAYLSTLFKTNMGITFIEYLTDIRIRKAKILLKQTHLKNYEVAEKVGYHDSRYFSQIFKKKVGLSPSEFRESLLQSS